MCNKKGPRRPLFILTNISLFITIDKFNFNHKFYFTVEMKEFGWGCNLGLDYIDNYKTFYNDRM